MDIREAIRRHLEWKVRLEWMLCGHQPLDAAGLSRHDQCELGGWLAGEAATRYGGDPSLTKAIDAHHRFHEICGAIAGAIESGERDRAVSLLTPGGAFTQASWAIVEALDELARRAGTTHR